MINVFVAVGSASTLRDTLGKVGVHVLVHFSCVASIADIITSSTKLLASVSVQDIVTARAVFVFQANQSHIVNVYELPTQGAISSFTWSFLKVVSTGTRKFLDAVVVRAPRQKGLL